MNRDSLPDSELDELLSGFVDGTLDEESEAKLKARLKADPEARRHYLHYNALDASLAWDYAELAAEKEERFVPVAAENRVLKVVAPLAVAALVCMGFFLFLRGGVESPILTVEFADGAEFRRADGVDVLQPGDQLPSGTLSIESPSGAAELMFKDGTLITLNGGSEVDFSVTDGGKSLRVKSGQLTAKVAPQPDGKPLRILTPTAEVEVLGTILRLDTLAYRTGLTVDEGRVRLRRLTDGQAIEVPAHHRTEASLHSSADLTVRKATAPGVGWEIRSKDVTKARRLTSADGNTVYGAVPYVAGRRPDGTKIVRSGISFNGALASMQPSSQIRIRYRAEGKSTLFLGTNQRSGRFGGNFEYDIHRDEVEADEVGWKEVLIPIERFKLTSKLGNRGFELEENVLTKVLVSVGEGKDLEVASIAVEARGGL